MLYSSAFLEYDLMLTALQVKGQPFMAFFVKGKHPTTPALGSTGVFRNLETNRGRVFDFLEER